MAGVTVRTLRPPDASVHGTLFLPPHASAAVLLIGGSGGSEPSYVGSALAAEGIAALSVAYFGRPGLPGQLRGIELEYFFSALALLLEVSGPGVPLVVLGMSRGSEAAMLTAIHSGLRVSGVVATVPGNVVAGSWPPGGPAWLLDSRPLPYVAHSGPECEDEAAFIPVELVPCPILLVAAGADRVWPSPTWRGRCPGACASGAILTVMRSWSTPTPGTRLGTWCRGCRRVCCRLTLTTTLEIRRRAPTPGRRPSSSSGGFGSESGWRDLNPRPRAPKIGSGSESGNRCYGKIAAQRAFSVSQCTLVEGSAAPSG
jgi:dienelactone hydrolase